MIEWEYLPPFFCTNLGYRWSFSFQYKLQVFFSWCQWPKVRIWKHPNLVLGPCLGVTIKLNQEIFFPPTHIFNIWHRIILARNLLKDFFSHLLFWIKMLAYRCPQQYCLIGLLTFSAGKTVGGGDTGVQFVLA